MGKLFIVSTPIGNLEDTTLRALKVLRDVHIILAEDTRSTKNLLMHHKIDIDSKRLISFFEGNEERRLEEVIGLLQAGHNIALVSESGTPLISDPGFKLVRESARLGIEIEAIPGPTALIAALVLSGLPTNAFLFLGFLPKKEGKARKLLMVAKNISATSDVIKTLAFYESPHRLIKTLHLIEQVFGNIDIVIARELTKIYEEVRREKINIALEHFEKHAPKGEFVVLLPLSK